MEAMITTNTSLFLDLSPDLNMNIQFAYMVSSMKLPCMICPCYWSLSTIFFYLIYHFLVFYLTQYLEIHAVMQGATIEHMAVIITPATDYKLPASVLADLEVEPCHIQISH